MNILGFWYQFWLMMRIVMRIVMMMNMMMNMMNYDDENLGFFPCFG